MTPIACPMCVASPDAGVGDCEICHGSGRVTPRQLEAYWLGRSWSADEMRRCCLGCGRQWGGVPWAPVSHGYCSPGCVPTEMRGSEEE